MTSTRIIRPILTTKISLNTSPPTMPSAPEIHENVSLAELNTFGMDIKCRFYCQIKSVDDLRYLIHETELLKWYPVLVLGGGSNILFTRHFDGIVLHNCLSGLQFAAATDHVLLTAASGENWHKTVLETVSRNLSGFENLSLVPGTVGASPIQNIGAYGVEVKDTILYVDTIHLATGEERRFSAMECQFAYRTSIFKTELAGQYFITSVTYRLSQTPSQLSISYGAIQNVLNDQHITNPTIADISRAVIQIRQSKLPDPKLIGNAGSFFKNPEISLEHFNRLKAQFPDISGYTVPNPDHIKVPAGWLIEQLGWKGYTQGSIGVHKNQALVLVNYGGGSGEHIYQLACTIQASVQERFGIPLEMEVNII